MPGLGRLHAPDERDQDYRIRAIVAESERPFRYWRDGGWWGDQGDTSKCVAFSWAHWLEDGPVGHPGPAPIVAPDVLYAEAQTLDEWPGVDYDGTSVRAGAKALKARGLISEYRWSHSLDGLLRAVLEAGPVVVGLNWYSGFFHPDRDGVIGLDGWGETAGGHAFVVNGVTRSHQMFRAKNSWGRGWGVDGRFWIPFDVMARLIGEDGEVCLAIEAKGD